MKATSLRIGNYVNEEILGDNIISDVCSNVVMVQVDNVDIDGSSNKRTFTLNYKNIKPIPLTEEWLLKLGFEKRSDYHKDNIRICLRFNSKHKIGIQSKKVFTLLTEIKYVHQLQNLYFALTNKELNNE